MPGARSRLEEATGQSWKRAYGERRADRARQRFAGFGESAAARVLRTIGESRTPVKTLSGYIRHLADREAMERNARSIPPAESAACSSGPSQGDSPSAPSPKPDDSEGGPLLMLRGFSGG